MWNICRQLCYQSHVILKYVYICIYTHFTDVTVVTVVTKRTNKINEIINATIKDAYKRKQVIFQVILSTDRVNGKKNASCLPCKTGV